jgi:hypothetical protein
MRRRRSPDAVIATTTATHGTLPRPEAPSHVTRGIRVIFRPRRRLSRRWSHRRPRRSRRDRALDGDDGIGAESQITTMKQNPTYRHKIG